MNKKKTTTPPLYPNSKITRMTPKKSYPLPKTSNFKRTQLTSHRSSKDKGGTIYKLGKKKRANIHRPTPEKKSTKDRNNNNNTKSEDKAQIIPRNEKVQPRKSTRHKK